MFKIIFLLAITVSIKANALEHKSAYTEFDDIKSMDYNAIEQKINDQFLDFDRNITNQLHNFNNELRSGRLNSINNSFTYTVRSEDKVANLGFIKKYNDEVGSCILMFDYDECKKLTKKEQNGFSDYIKIESSEKEIYSFFKAHEMAHLIEDYSPFTKLGIEDKRKVRESDVDLFRAHYLEAFADMYAALKINASDELISDIIKLRDNLYFLENDYLHYTSPYLKKIKKINLNEVDESDYFNIIDDVFISVFSTLMLDYKLEYDTNGRKLSYKIADYLFEIKNEKINNFAKYITEIKNRYSN